MPREARTMALRTRPPLGFADGTTTLVIGVAEGDIIDVKSGVTTAAFTATGCLNDNGDGFD